MIYKIFKKLLSKSSDLIKGFFWYFRDLFKYKRLMKLKNIKLNFYLFPQIFDKNPSSHTFDKHYVYMDRWAFKNIYNAKPEEHVDIGSSIRFLSMASVVTKLNFVDIRPVKLDFDNFKCTEGSILNLPFENNSVNSFSCLHVAEHIGLGRYGDPLDAEGTIKACKEITRVLAKGGILYFALPVGKNSIYFNAHRVHSPSLILEYFKDLKLVSFCAVNDQGRFVENAKINDYENSRYACGMYIFTK